MRAEIVNFEDLSDSREMLEAKEPNFIAVFIYGFLLIVLIALAWMWFGEVDIVVKATGVVRPEENISLIRNINGGNIEEINYYQNQEVEEGDLLYQIDTQSLENRKNNIRRDIKRRKDNIKKLNKLEKSIREDKNLLSQEDINYYNRYLVYRSGYEQRSLDYQRANNRYQRELSLSSNSTTRSRIEELKSEYRYAKLSRDSYRSEFLVNIKNEIENEEDRLTRLEEELKDIKDNIRRSRVRAPISGTVQILERFNRGDYLPSGVEVLRVVPSNSSDYRVELTVRNEDISQLEEGQQINYRFLALPYKEYGILNGEISKISSDANMSRVEEGLYYNVEATLDDIKLYDKQGDPAFVRIGMLNEARIVVRRKKILHIVLEKLDFIS
ncbi:HlyD family efflux transporter periplasmic adaptor subunit [Halonatronum saccharophilum]|uniref:HlyD family efflux transporter periplasmic adaptor subunit n=1 Tax=Halonatronum saccharophilum TaxID=150060 RepID=UPI0004825F0E|nr:HlyD family efflux transporter periplasmic adaptor subunit [Halonatronum saccharophilum]